MSRIVDTAAAHELASRGHADGGPHWRRTRDCGSGSARRVPPGFFLGLAIILVAVSLFFAILSQWMLSVR